MASLRLFQLPKSVQNGILEKMETIDQIALSVCSKRCKASIKNLNLKATYLILQFFQDLQIILKFKTLPEIRLFLLDPLHPNEQRIIDKPHDVINQQWTNLSFGVDFWIRHLMSVFHDPWIRCFFEWPGNLYNMDSLYRTLRGLKIEIMILDELNEQMFGAILSWSFSPKKLLLSRNAYQNENLMRKILAGNLDGLLSPVYFTTYFSSLPNLLSNNSKVIIISRSSFSDKDFNRFLKLWMTGANPRLEKLKFLFRDNRQIDRTLVLRGVRHTVVTPELARQARFVAFHGPEERTANGRYRILRNDGVRGTLTFGQLNPAFNFHVWD